MTHVYYGENAPWLAIDHDDPSGDTLLIVANLAGCTQNVRPHDLTGLRELELWTLDPRYRGSSEPAARPIATAIDGGAVELLAWEAAIHHRGD